MKNKIFFSALISIVVSGACIFIGTITKVSHNIYANYFLDIGIFLFVLSLLLFIISIYRKSLGSKNE